MRAGRRFRDYLKAQLKDPAVREAYEGELTRSPAIASSSGRKVKHRRHLVRRISSKLNSSYTTS